MIPASRTARRTARWRTVSWRWWRRRCRVSGSSRSSWRGRPTATATRGRRSGTCGRVPVATPPSRRQHADRTRGGRWTRSRCRCNAGATAPGSSVTRSRSPLPCAHHDLMRREVDILHPQPGALEEPQSGAIEQHGHEPRRPVERLEHCADLFARENDRKALWPRGPHQVVEPGQLDVEHVAVQEQERRERLILRRRAHLALDRQGREEARTPPSPPSPPGGACRGTG